MAKAEVRIDQMQYRRALDAFDDVAKELHQLNSNLRKLIAAVGDIKEVEDGSAGQDAGTAADTA